MTIVLGHVLLALAAIAGIIAVLNLVRALSHGGHERGTPQYARARLARRKTFYSLGFAALFAALCVSPLCGIEVVRLG